MNLLQTFSESRLLPTSHSYAKLTARAAADLAYLHILGLRVCLSEPFVEREARHYAEKTIRHGGFDRWYGDTTDLHLLIHGLLDDEVAFRDPHESAKVRDHLRIDEPLIHSWIKDAVHNPLQETRTRRLLSRLDVMFRIIDGSLRDTRRLVQEWPTLDEREKQRAMRHLVHFFHSRGPHTEMRHMLDKLAHHTGLVPPRDEHLGEEREAPFLAMLHATVQARKVEEDASAGATSSGAIASVASPLAPVIRRNKASKPK